MASRGAWGDSETIYLRSKKDGRGAQIRSLTALSRCAQTQFLGSKKVKVGEKAVLGTRVRMRGGEMLLGLWHLVKPIRMGKA